ncbi:unnamed protein product [Trichobilharzia szidati]|nr:unnamed protein product [Trichobilharzia szidati]
MNDVAKFPEELKFLDLMACIRGDRNHLGSNSIRTGPYLIRYSTFLNHLQRIAVHCGLQLSSGSCVGGGNSAGSLVWRLTSECFAVVVAATNNSTCGSDSAYSTSPKLTDLISIAAVYFEFNHDKAVPCPELATDLSMGRYSSLLQHVDNLLTIYAVPGDKIDRARTYLCLQALEKDLSMLTQAIRTDLENNMDAINTFRRAPNQKHDVFSMRDLVNRSLVGHFVGRTGGRLARLTYLVTSAQAMISNAAGVLKNDMQMNPKKPCSTSVGCGSPDGLIGGYMARIGLCPRLSYAGDTSTASHSTVQRLPFMPLVTLQKDAYGVSVPHFAQPDEIKCISIEAEFVLHLDPALPISTDAIQQLEQITGLSNTEIADRKEEDIMVLILRQHKQEYLRGINTHLQNPNLTHHSYQIQSDVKGYLVSSVPFTCSNQIGEIISILRKQASALAFYETFIVHPYKPVEKDSDLTFSFNIKIMAGQMVSVEFDDPNCLGEVHALLHVRPFDVQCVELHFPSNKCNQVGASNSEEERSLSPNRLCVETDKSLMDNFSKILTKTHTLPIGLVWLLTRLQCPIHKQLENAKLPLINTSKSNENSQISSLISQKQLNSLKTMINRVKNSIVIRGTTGTDGILCGGHLKTSVDFESSSLTAAPIFTLNTSNYLNGSKKIPPLPPGVMATPPPAFTHLDTNSGDLGIISSLRPMNSQNKFRDTHSNTISAGISTNPSRGLRLDDLLVDSTFQSQPHDQQRNLPVVSFPHSLPTYASTIPGTHSTILPDVKDTYSSIINSNISVSNHSISGMHSTSQKCSTSILTGSNNNMIPSSYSIPSISVTSSISMTSSSLSVTKSKSFTASPVIDSSRTSSTSGSMLVNLLNEDSLPNSTPLISPSTMSDRHLYTSSHSLINLQNVPLTSSANTNVPSSRLSGLMLPSNAPAVSSDAQLSQGFGKSLSSSAPNLTANSSQYLPVRHSNPITLNSSRTKHSNIKHGQTGLTSDPATNAKKPRKRRRGTVESGFNCVSNQKVNTPPGVYPNYPTSKLQRVDTTSPSTTNSVTGSYQRANFNQTNPNFVPCSVSYVQQSTMSSTIQTSSMPISNPSKSVYDFDDTPGSMFDVPVGNISSSNSLSFSSGSSLTSPKSSVSANPLQLSGLTVSSSNQIANYPVTTTVASTSNLERTIERKTSLKMTIKTIPSQPVTSTPKTGVNFSQNEIDKYNRMQSVQSNSMPSNTLDSTRMADQNHPLISVKKRKKRSVEGKPSAYMLQMLQLANSSSMTGCETSIITTSSGIDASGTPGQSEITSVVLNNPSLKHIKGANKVVGHGSVLVKKERKRRLGHGFTEKTQFSFIPSNSTYNQLAEINEASNVPKPIKINRLQKPNTDMPRDIITASVASTNMYSNYVSVSPNSFSSKKKVSTITSFSVGSSVTSGSCSDDMLVAKRLFPSSTTSLVNNEKRKRNVDTLKQSVTSQPSCPTSSTPSDSAFTASPQFVPASSDPSPNGNPTRKAPRLSQNSAANSSRALNIPTSRIQSSSVCSTTVMNSSATTTTIVNSSSGLIKGYKIPKKKSMITDGLPNIQLPDASNEKSSGILSSTLRQIQENILYRDTPDSQSPERSNESTLTIVENLYSNSNDRNNECTETINTISHAITPQSNTSASGQIAQSFQQQLPRKSSVKSISDIVDKLRAKSTTGVPSVTTPTFVSGSSETGNSDTTVTTASDTQELSSDVTDQVGCIRSMPRRGDESQEQWRDNIFEKFCHSGTPTPHQVEAGQNSMSKLDSEGDLAASNDVDEEPTWVAGDKDTSVTNPSEQCIPISSANTPGLSANSQSTSDSDGKQDREQFEIIKANTDTPASPTEFLTNVSTPTSNVSSKIIPISPTSGKCITSPKSLSSPNMKPNIIRHNSARFEKKTGSGRFSRLSGNGMTLHGSLIQRNNSDSYGHPGSGHGHPNRLLRGGLNNPHHSKAPNFKPPTNWGSMNMDYSNMGVSPSSSASAAAAAAAAAAGAPPVPNDVNNGNMGHWMMNNGNMNPNNLNMMPYNSPHSLPPHHPYHSAPSRPMRPNYPGLSGNTGHNLYNAGMMRGNKK